MWYFSFTFGYLDNDDAVVSPCVGASGRVLLPGQALSDAARGGCPAFQESLHPHPAQH